MRHKMNTVLGFAKLVWFLLSCPRRIAQEESSEGPKWWVLVIPTVR